MTATCLPHGAPSVATCARCGVFLCEQDVRPLEAHTYCAACVARPDVDFLETYRLKYFGRRKDGWSWFFGLGGLATVTTAVLVAVTSDGRKETDAEGFVLDLLFVALGGLQLAWFFRQRWARVALPLFVFAYGLRLLVVGHLPWVLPQVFFPAAVVAAAFSSVRSQLFFRLPVSRERLRRHWSLYHDERIARAAASMGVVGLIIPPFVVPAVACGLIGLWRVDPLARPPRGDRRAALIGVGLGVVGIIQWGLFAFQTTG